MEKIRLTKDLPGDNKTGKEFNVREDKNTLGEHIRVDQDERWWYFKLSDLKGMYEVVRWEPKANEPYKFITDEFIVAISERTCQKDEKRIEGGNCFHPGSTDADNALKRILAF